MTSLPAEVTYGTVVGKFVKAIADSGDVDTNPDSAPVAGSVTFAPISALKVASSTPPVTILPQPITVTLDDSGALSVKLVATDDPATNPHDWSYLVTFAFQGVKYPSFSFELPAGTTQDLTVLAPVSTTQAGTPIVRGVGITSSDVDEDGNLVLGMSDGTTLTTADFVANVAAAMAGNYVARPGSPVAGTVPTVQGDGSIVYTGVSQIAGSKDDLGIVTVGVSTQWSYDPAGNLFFSEDFSVPAGNAPAYAYYDASGHLTTTKIAS